MTPKSMFLVALLFSVGTAGCVGSPTINGATSETLQQPAIFCPSGALLAGISETGTPTCSIPLASFQCPPGQFIRGFGLDGEPNCSSMPTKGSETTSQTHEVSSNLKVIGVYGMRNTTTDNLSSLKVNTELSAGSPNLDLKQLAIRYSDGSNTDSYGYGAWTATWIRGTNSSAIMQSGDLVELRFNLGTELGPRTDVEILIIPGENTPVIANFKAPATYGDSTTVALR